MSLFVAQTLCLKDEDNVILLIKMVEIREELGELKESLHQRGCKFGMCLLPILDFELEMWTPNLVPFNDEGNNLGKAN